MKVITVIKCNTDFSETYETHFIEYTIAQRNFKKMYVLFQYNGEMST